MIHLAVENVEFTYPDGTQALKGISFTVNKGEKTFIIGPNGAGKSTLFLSILGFLHFRGSIKIDNISVSPETAREVRSKVGIVFQDPDDQIFMPSVWEDVVFGARLRISKETAEENAKKAMLTAGLTGFENRAAHHLSFGEKKRVAIAGVLAMKPDVILLDEPTSNLDHLHRMHLIETLRNIDSTLLVATHDMKLVCELADRIVIMKDGMTFAEGLPSEILTDTELLHKAHLEQPCECDLTRLLSRIKS
jgi:cobalt/nickel transport system ATP-binding protein